MPSKYQPTPRTDSGWSWSDFWNWYRVQPKDIQKWTYDTNDLAAQVRAMAPDVQNEVLFYAPVDVQARFNYGALGRIHNKRSIIRKIMRTL